MFGYIIVFGLLLAVCYWIITPLLQEEGRRHGITPQPEDVLEKLKKKKDGVYATIRELEFDLRMGKLSETDFQILKHQYIQEAAGYMQEMDKLEMPTTTVSEHTAAVSENETRRTDMPSAAPQPAARKYIYCSACGERAALEDRFCSACGHNLHKNRITRAPMGEYQEKEIEKKNEA